MTEVYPREEKEKNCPSIIATLHISYSDEKSPKQPLNHEHMNVFFEIKLIYEVTKSSNIVFIFSLESIEQPLRC